MYELHPLLSADIASFASVIARVKREEFGAELDVEALACRESASLSAQLVTSRTRYVILTSDSGVVGGGGIITFDGNPETVCELTNIFLLPEARGQGMGRAILERCLTLAKELGFEHCYLQTMTAMVAARSLYLKSGFNPLSAPLRQGCPEYIDHWMIRNL